MMTTARDRALGAFFGLAIGDALGMPTQQLPRSIVRDRFGLVRAFHDGPPENSISAGMRAGTITDDTEQAVIVAELLADGTGSIDQHEFANRLRRWEQIATARGGEQLGPSTRRALDALHAGVPIGEAGRRGDTNGAAMRIAPVGVATTPRPLGHLVDRVEAASTLTHHTGLAISGAAAVAAVVSVGVDGGRLSDAIAIACEAAEVGLQRGFYSAGASVSRRIRFALELARSISAEDDFLTEVAELVGTGVATQESVPAAFALAARWPRNAWQACCAAASLGGDTDTIGAITGAMLGATLGISRLPPDAVEQVRSINKLHPEPLIDRLLALRGGRLNS
jgi:ADP-ribosylglycohydrolase